MSDSSLISPWRRDIPAALVVVLVAIPFCLGIALASGAPLSAGIVSGVVGGLLVGALSGSSLMVSGPAAGLAAVVLAGIASAGSFRGFLVAVVLAGVLQISFGAMGMGVIGWYFPTAVVRGMMAAIGIILILKQLPHAVGYDGVLEGDEAFRHTDHQNTFSALSQTFDSVHWGAAIVTACALFTLIAWEKWRPARLHFALGALASVLVGVVLNAVFPYVNDTLTLQTSHLVQLPVAITSTEFFTHFQFPDWSTVSAPSTWRIAVTLAVVASLESLLSLDATDKMDPHTRAADPSRELMAQGAGNVLCGLLGGLPVAGVIVRSAANVDAGAQSRRSTMLHGVCILLALMVLPALLNHIPLAALAAMLLYVGYRLATPRVFRHMWVQGRVPFVPFIVTVVAMVLTDLLVGILIGLAVGVLVVLIEQMRQPALRVISLPGAVLTRLVLPEHATFLNKGSIARTLNSITPSSRVEVDGRQTSRIDFDVLELLYEFQETAKLKNIDFRLVGVPAHADLTTLTN